MEELSASLGHAACSAQPGVGMKTPRAREDGQFIRGVNGPGCRQSLHFTLKNYWKGFQLTGRAIGFSVGPHN